ncbi:MAG TPA: adenylate/guanylate cyclase domain-containing protein [Chloroflexia bacterium]|nr:adenylate/guanylate cyclase domain-containing protein [Chloroflexia bacterium]
MTESWTAYLHLDRRITGVSILANGSGALITFIYFNVIDPVPQGSAVVQSLAPGQIGWFALVLVGLLTLGSLSNRPVMRPISAWAAGNARRPAGAPAIPPPPAVQRALLNYVPWTTLVGFGVWILAGLIFSNPAWSESFGAGLRSFLAIVGVGGVLSTALFFFVADVVWRPLIARAFPGGQVAAVRAFRLPLRVRLLIVFLLAGLLPVLLLVAATLNRLPAIRAAADPQVILDNLAIVQFFIVGVALIISATTAVFVSYSILHPLRALQGAMARIGQHDLAARVPVQTNDELGYLSDHFNTMAAGLQQGELVRTLLNLYVSPEVASAIVAQGARMGGELVECTVLFSDIRGFTSLAEGLPPTELIALLNRYMGRMIPVIVAAGGIVNKFGGDSILALFGTPVNPAPDHAARAVRAALGMRAALAAFNAAEARGPRPQLRTGIGIASGPAVAGNVGDAARVEYTVIGDTVNLASRLQDLTKELGVDILVSAATYTAAATTLPLFGTALPPVAIRGKRDSVQVYVLDGG